MALSRSEGKYSLHDSENDDVTSSLTGLYPYLRYGVTERFSVWGMAGFGQGTLTLTEDGGESIKTDIGLTMGAVGARGELPSPTGEKDSTLILKMDALFLKITSDGVPGLTAADASRLRLALENTYEHILDSGVSLAPYIEAGLRYDGGDAETGLGVEVGGGFQYAHPEQTLTLELNTYGLLVHETSGFAEWGVSGALRYDPAPSSEFGPSFTLSPTWGSTSSSGVGALWERQTMADLAANDTHASDGGLDAELSYGLPVYGGRGAGTPYAGLRLAESDRVWRLGYRLHFDSSLDLNLEGARHESTNDDDGGADHEIRWGVHCDGSTAPDPCYRPLAWTCAENGRISHIHG